MRQRIGNADGVARCIILVAGDVACDGTARCDQLPQSVVGVGRGVRQCIGHGHSIADRAVCMVVAPDVGAGNNAIQFVVGVTDNADPSRTSVVMVDNA